MDLLILWLVTAVSLYIIAQLSQFTGVEIDGFQRALISSAVFGILNVLVRPILATVTLPFSIIFTSFLITLVLNMIIFGLAAWLVNGFRLRWGIMSALIGALALSFINSLIYQIFPI